MPLRPTNVGDTVKYYNAHGETQNVKIDAVQGFAFPSTQLIATGFTTGGTLAAGNFFYRVSYVRGGIESVACAEVTGNVASGSTGRVDLSWTAIPNATTYKIYGRTTGAELLMATQAGITFSDTGGVTPSGALPAADGKANFTGLHDNVVRTNILAGMTANTYENRW